MPRASAQRTKGSSHDGQPADPDHPDRPWARMWPTWRRIRGSRSPTTATRDPSPGGLRRNPAFIGRSHEACVPPVYRFVPATSLYAFHVFVDSTSNGRLLCARTTRNATASPPSCACTTTSW